MGVPARTENGERRVTAIVHLLVVAVHHHRDRAGDFLASPFTSPRCVEERVRMNGIGQLPYNIAVRAVRGLALTCSRLLTAAFGAEIDHAR